MTKPEIATKIDISKLRRYDEQFLAMAFMDSAITGRTDFIASVMTWFKPSYISDDFYADIVTGILGLLEDEEPVADHAVMRHIIESSKGYDVSMRDVSKMASMCVSQASNIEYYAKRVWDVRRANEAADSLSDSSEDLRSGEPIDPVFTAVTEIVSKYAPAPERRRQANAEVFVDMINELDGKGAKKTMLATGLSAFDAMTGGIPQTAMVVVGAKTGCGKSVFLAQCALLHVINYKQPVVLFSLEMSVSEVYDRWAAYLAKTNKAANAGEWSVGLGRVRDYVSSGLLNVVCGDFGAEQIENEVVARSKVAKLGLIIVDYLQLVKPPKRSVNREEQVNEIARNLKQLTSKVGVPVIVASQLNDDGALRESRAIGMHANIVVIIKPKGNGNAVDVELEIVKSRSSPTGTCTAIWEKPIFTIRDNEIEDGYTATTTDNWGK